MNVIWTSLAESQVADAFAYIAADRPAAALKWFERLVRSVGSLSLLPDQGRMVPEAAPRVDPRGVGGAVSGRLSPR